MGRDARSPTAVGAAGPGENHGIRGSYHHYADVQRAAMGFVATGIDVECRLVSGLFHDPRCGFEVATANGLTHPDQFLDPAHGDVFHVLMLIGSGEIPFHDDEGDRLEFVQRCLRHIGREFWQPDGVDELHRMLVLSECSAAGVSSYAKLIVRAARNRVQIRRLWRSLVDRLVKPEREPAIKVDWAKPARKGAA